jgi:hypothetical protein
LAALEICPDVLVKIFNFPTYAESYRIAALDLLGRRAQRAALQPSTAAAE